MNVHDTSLQVYGFETTDEALAHVWHNDISDKETDKRRAPTSEEVANAIKGASNILDTTEWGSDVRRLIAPCITTPATGEDLWDVSSKDGNLLINHLHFHLLNEASLALQQTRKANDVVSPLRLLLLACIEAKEHYRWDPIGVADARIEVDPVHRTTTIPKAHDIANNISFRGGIESVCTEGGLTVAQMVRYWDDELTWTGSRPPKSTSGFHPRQSHVVLFLEKYQIAPEEPHGLVYAAMMDTFRNSDARGPILGDIERLAHLAMALSNTTSIPLDLIMEYMIKPSSRNKRRWINMNKERVRKALILSNVLHVMMPDSMPGDIGHPVPIMQVEKRRGGKKEDVPYYAIGRTRYVDEVLMPGADAAAVRLSGDLYRRIQSDNASPLVGRFYTVAEQIVSYSGGLEYTPSVKRLMPPLMHPDNREHGIEFTASEWAVRCGLKYDAAIKATYNTVHRRMNHVLKNIIERQKHFATTVEFWKPRSKDKFIGVRATPDFIEAYKTPKKKRNRSMTLAELLMDIERAEQGCITNIEEDEGTAGD